MLKSGHVSDSEWNVVNTNVYHPHTYFYTSKHRWTKSSSLFTFEVRRFDDFGFSIKHKGREIKIEEDPWKFVYITAKQRKNFFHFDELSAENSQLALCEFESCPSLKIGN